jgi:hypothetical protein
VRCSATSYALRFKLIGITISLYWHFTLLFEIRKLFAADRLSEYA